MEELDLKSLKKSAMKLFALFKTHPKLNSTLFQLKHANGKDFSMFKKLIKLVKHGPVGLIKAKVYFDKLLNTDPFKIN
ncbi:hypothetical protein [Marinifilum caeruleilacunae]|uniref:Uncharacterized protein n=1 Tax=Marinifilum caeruleilacunae TaxID=2499076 RepID=A0ABX1WR51_9BACT|nr:hypothetical protein [Marinifilum caeruleilacunae]NOU58486.1 hypothetical protein [Marinifilum caeruleilacunae]